jgi:hypothetical protein
VRNIPEDGILYNHRSENLKSYKIQEGFRNSGHFRLHGSVCCLNQFVLLFDPEHGDHMFIRNVD